MNGCHAASHFGEQVLYRAADAVMICILSNDVVCGLLNFHELLALERSSIQRGGQRCLMYQLIQCCLSTALGTLEL